MVLARARRDMVFGVVLGLVWHFVGVWSWARSAVIGGALVAAGVCSEFLFVRYPGLRFEARQAKRLARRRGQHE